VRERRFPEEGRRTPFNAAFRLAAFNAAFRLATRLKARTKSKKDS